MPQRLNGAAAAGVLAFGRALDIFRPLRVEEGKEDDDVPKVEEGYFSAIAARKSTQAAQEHKESPLEIYRCSSYCPGGRPGAKLLGV